ncbi:MAG TPA: hypothetical protein VFT95_05650 [Micromonosporaceae bacterium]|nr:hypothetical protein [Micromonosporaceae bacterium]
MHALARCAALLALAALPVAGCADQGSSGGSPEPAAPGSPSASAAPGRTDPKALVGAWTPEGDGVPAGVSLILEASGELRVKQACTLLGSWAADPDGLLVASVSGATDCPAADPVPPRWLTGVAGYRIEDNPVLLDQAGKPVVTLLPGNAADRLSPAPPDPSAPADPNTAWREPAAALPAGLTAATRETLVGRWEPTGAAKSQPKPAFAEFLASGEWRGSDGCNGLSGRWTVGEAGAFLATTGPTTLIACDNVPIAQWIGEARRAGLNGTELVLLDGAAKELGRLTKAA